MFTIVALVKNLVELNGWQFLIAENLIEVIVNLLATLSSDNLNGLD